MHTHDCLLACHVPSPTFLALSTDAYLSLTLFLFPPSVENALRRAAAVSFFPFVLCVSRCFRLVRETRLAKCRLFSAKGGWREMVRNLGYLNMRQVQNRGKKNPGTHFLCMIFSGNSSFSYGMRGHGVPEVISLSQFWCARTRTVRPSILYTPPHFESFYVFFLSRSGGQVT